MKTKRIYTLRVAEKLIQKGHNMVNVIPNPNNPRYKAYIFEKTEALMNSLTEITLAGK